MIQFERVIKENKEILKILIEYKTEICDQNEEHEKWKCFKSHRNETELRRQVFDFENKCFKYNAVLCNEIECIEEKSCLNAHNKYELNFHPLFYKVQICKDLQTCKKERWFCTNYHSEADRRWLHVEEVETEKNQNENIQNLEKLQQKEVASSEDQEEQNDENSFRNESQNNDELGNKQEDQFQLSTFKTKPCLNQNNKHSLKHCLYYHNEFDRRRPAHFKYTFDQCPNIKSNSKICQNKDNCQYAHNKVEQLYHIDRYKSKFCQQYPKQIDMCEYKDYCSFAHSEHEIVIELLDKMENTDDFNVFKYKTVWCPNTFNHDRGSCPYAHNVQDFRRNPVQLEPEECPHWIKGENVTQYNQSGCNNGLRCNLCHGWKELEYHPLVYKTKQCTNRLNCKKRDCAYYHTQKEKNKGLLGQQSYINNQASAGQPLHSFDNMNSNKMNGNYYNQQNKDKNQSNYRHYNKNFNNNNNSQNYNSLKNNNNNIDNNFNNQNNNQQNNNNNIMNSNQNKQRFNQSQQSQYSRPIQIIHQEMQPQVQPQQPVQHTQQKQNSNNQQIISNQNQNQVDFNNQIKKNSSCFPSGSVSTKNNSIQSQPSRDNSQDSFNSNYSIITNVQHKVENNRLPFSNDILTVGIKQKMNINVPPYNPNEKLFKNSEVLNCQQTQVFKSGFVQSEQMIIGEPTLLKKKYNSAPQTPDQSSNIKDLNQQLKQQIDYISQFDIGLTIYNQYSNKFQQKFKNYKLEYLLSQFQQNYYTEKSVLQFTNNDLQRIIFAHENDKSQLIKVIEELKIQQKDEEENEFQEIQNLINLDINLVAQNVNQISQNNNFPFNNFQQQ